MLGTLLRRVTVKTLDAVVERAEGSQRAPVRTAGRVLDRARGIVGLTVVRREAPLPDWSRAHPDQPMWETDKKKLHKHRVDTGIVEEQDQGDQPGKEEKPAIEVFFKRGCPSARAAMDLLREREIEFAERDVKGDSATLSWLKIVTKSNTTPQIFVHGKTIGGFDELRELDQAGKLREALEPKVEKKKVSLPVVHPEHSPFEGLADEWDGGDVEELEGDALVSRVREVLDECRPLVQADGGDIELLDVKGDTVHLQLTGNCIGCPSSQATLRQGIERRLKSRIPQLSGISSPQLEPLH